MGLKWDGKPKINQNKAIFLASKRLIFKTSKLIKLNQIKYLLAPLHNWMTCFVAIHVPETLAKILALEIAKETILSLKAEVTGSSRDATEGKWVLSGKIEIPCIYKVYGRIGQKSYLRKKIEGTK